MMPSAGVLAENTDNIMIEGENLQVLKVLLRSYQGRVKCIYIDPPYNTGSDRIYPDSWSESRKDYLERVGDMREGIQMKSLTASDGHRHSNWLSHISSRLRVARSLLHNEGAIFVSIDDNEQHNLRKLMDATFGEENFMGQMTWAAGRKNDSKFISNSHQYIVCYAKNKSYLNERGIKWRQRKKGIDDIYAKYDSLKRKHGEDVQQIELALRKWYKSLDDSDPARRQKHYTCVDRKGIYFPDNISWPGGGGPKYEVLHPVTGKPCAVPSRGWMFSTSDKMQECIEAGNVHFGKDETQVPCIKSYLKDREYEVSYSVFYQDGRAATKRLRSLMGADVFKHPKDEEILAEIVEFSTRHDKESINHGFLCRIWQHCSRSDVAECN